MYILISHIGDEAVITLNLKNEDEIYKAMSKATALRADPDDITHRVFKEADEVSFKTVIQFT